RPLSQAVTLTQAVTPANAAPSGVQRISSGMQAAKLISKPQPVYPAIAKSARVQGVVSLQVTIAPDGTVQNLQLLDAGSPLLVQAAMDAVKQWVYQPTL